MKFIRVIKSSLLNENSLGEPITNNEQTLQNFWSWFNGSKVIDEKGRPLVVYHGTTKKFDTFDKSKIGLRDSWYGQGFYFTPNYDTAKHYYTKTPGGNYSKSGHVKNLYLCIKNPFIVNNWTEIMNEYGQLKKPDYLNNFDYNKYDGIFIYEQRSNAFGTTKNIYEIIAFEPNQIKSVSNNINYNKEDNSIYGSKL